MESWDHTVYDVTVLDLLQDFGPDVGMAFLVCRHGRWLEVDDLSDTANLRHFVCVYKNSIAIDCGLGGVCGVVVWGRRKKGPQADEIADLGELSMKKERPIIESSQ